MLYLCTKSYTLSVQFSCSVMSNSLRPHGLQHSRLPCPLGLTGLIYLQSQDWFDLLVGTLKNLLQYHTSKTLILRHSTFFTVQLSHPYMTTGKAIALTGQNFVGKVMSLLFNMLSRLVITFLPRSVSFNFMAAVTIFSDSGAPQNKVWHCCHCFPIYFPLSDETRCHDLHFLNVEF